MFSISVIVVNFRTPIFHKTGMTLKFRHILKNYIINEGFLVDLMGALPVNLILGGIYIMHQNRIIYAFLRLTRVINLLRMTFLMEKF
jgi:hypothetical protein